MCGRYARRSDKQKIAEHYGIPRTSLDPPGEPEHAFAPDYNASPGTFQPVIRLNHETGDREITAMNWGLVPYWSKERKSLAPNSRDDKLESSGAWKEPFKRRRCLIPAEFFYEWEPATAEMKRGKITRPWAIALKDERLFSFGGIWDRWRDRGTGTAFQSFNIITTEPNELLEPFHNRCPLIIEPRNYQRWLTPSDPEDPGTLPTDLLKIYPDEALKAWRVNPIAQGSNGPQLLAPIAAEPTLPSNGNLFAE